MDKDTQIFILSQMFDVIEVYENLKTMKQVKEYTIKQKENILSQLDKLKEPSTSGQTENR